MARANCRYCEAIGQHDGGYEVQEARHARDAYPRCDYHWRFVCAHCGDARHFNGTAFCPREERFFCLHCAPEHRAFQEGFWGWSYYYHARCPWHEEWHPALDYLEFRGEHPWQVRPSWEQEKRGLSTQEQIEPLWAFETAPTDSVSDDDVRRGWENVAGWWVSHYSPKGDVNREWVIDPVLLDFLGDVEGLRVLDAGCGAGYLARLLAQKGATVQGVDLSPALLSFAKQEEAQEPLGIEFHEADLADLSAFAEDSFDAVVSNVALQDVHRYREALGEISRVLQAGGRFIFSITHPAFDLPGRWVREPEDSERVEEWRHFAKDRYFDRDVVFWSPPDTPPVVGFHRPLRDYTEALHDAGFVILRLEEPVPSDEALEKHYRQMADLFRVPNFLIIDARKP